MGTHLYEGDPNIESISPIQEVSSTTAPTSKGIPRNQAVGGSSDRIGADESTHPNPGIPHNDHRSDLDDVLGSVRALGGWLEQDISARHAELRALLGRMDSLADSLDRLNTRLDTMTSMGTHDGSTGHYVIDTGEGIAAGTPPAVNNPPDATSSPIQPSMQHSVVFDLLKTGEITLSPRESNSSPPSPSNTRVSRTGLASYHTNQLMRRPNHRRMLDPIVTSHLGQGLQRRPPAIIEPFVAVDPFRVQVHRHTSRPPSNYTTHEDEHTDDEKDKTACLPLPVFVYPPSSAKHLQWRTICTFMISTVPAQLYLHFLLRLPALYFSRVARIFEDAELSFPDIKRMASRAPDAMTWTGERASLPSTVKQFKRNWESFITSLLKEWKTLNIVSALMLSAILTILQVQNTGADSATRTPAVLSLVCALMSLLYGCVYTIRFGSMKSLHKASSWAEETQKHKTILLWNVWIFLAMPAIWLSWSILLFIACILAFVWDTGATSNPSSSSPSSPSIIGPQIAISVVLFLGLVYFIMIMKTLGRYGTKMDEAWMEKVKQWREDEYNTKVETWRRNTRKVGSLTTSPDEVTSEQVYGRLDPPCFSHAASTTVQYPSFPALKLVQDMNDVTCGLIAIPQVLVEHDIHPEDWQMYIRDVSLAWDEKFRVNTPNGIMNRRDTVINLVNLWNTAYFLPRAVEVVFCVEIYDDYPESDAGTLYDQFLDNPHAHIPTPKGKYSLYTICAPIGEPRRVLLPASGANNFTPEWLYPFVVHPNIRIIRPLTGTLPGAQSPSVVEQQRESISESSLTSGSPIGG